MLYLFYGTDVVKTRARAVEYAHNAAAEHGQVQTLSANEYAPGALRSLVGSVPLFGGEEVIVLDTLSENDEAFAELIESAEFIAGAPQRVIVIEAGLGAKDAKTLSTHAEDVVLSKAEQGEQFNPFSLADALAKKDKKSLWLLLRNALDTGLTPEEIIGTLSWQLKALRLAKIAKSPQEAGMKDFPFNKAKTSARQFTEGELDDLASRLVTLYHEGHLGADIELALEKWVLSI